MSEKGLFSILDGISVSSMGVSNVRLTSVLLDQSRGEERWRVIRPWVKGLGE